MPSVYRTFRLFHNTSLWDRPIVSDLLELVGRLLLTLNGEYEPRSYSLPSHLPRESGGVLIFSSYVFSLTTGREPCFFNLSIIFLHNVALCEMVKLLAPTRMVPVSILQKNVGSGIYIQDLK